MLLTFFAAALIAPAIVAPHETHRLSIQLIRRCPARADCVPRGVVSVMKREAERIWSSLDAELIWLDPVSTEGAARPAPELVVMLEEQPIPVVRPARYGLALAGLHPPEHRCDPGLAHLWVAHVRQYVDAVQVHGLPLTSLPNRFAHLVLGRALGRALAHEIGHYLLGEAHARHGLMRAQFTPQELLDASPRYDLDADGRRALTLRQSDSTAPRCLTPGERDPAAWRP